MKIKIPSFSGGKTGQLIDYSCSRKKKTDVKGPNGIVNFLKTLRLTERSLKWQRLII
jgi:hypothetical protein